eukprot:CAMPEP_0170527840 /NCGR_PEP_ID=MMETSP0209-20121228/13332_1 /TAXON_ID=665100 ORGANISM="Litonotus pictus, Strain P1" /NCGR_SAMPLE_ID=MMETSP0209 /ASSEMBLY_ACC=CAM_ASM_000301 /LENGTH=102 /DNA_ID=CAMNT_0010818663 /DNA_START=249 /DNA_END=557 /DNA_ORIENTATION=+
MNTAEATVESTAQDKEANKAREQLKQKIAVRMKAQEKLKESDTLYAKLKKELEEYMKIKKNRKVKPKKDVEEENNQLDLVQKYSSKQFLPADVNEKLNTFMG